MGAYRIKWITLSVSISFIIGFLDWITGYEFGLFVFYYIPVAIASWFLGFGSSVFISILSAVLWFISQVYSEYEFHSLFFAGWNTSIRFISFLVIGWSTYKLKQALSQLRATITEKNKVEDDLRTLTANLEQQVAERTAVAENRTKQLQSLTFDLIEAEEKERQNFAEMLHDDLQQLLASAKMQLSAARERMEYEDLDHVDEALNESILKIRHLSQEMSPPVLHSSGLTKVLKWLIQRMRDQFNMNIEFQMSVEGEDRINDPPLKRFIYRTVQEILFNVVKHSGVKDAKVLYNSHPDYLEVIISDLGRGFSTSIMNDSSKSGFGLLTIKERALYLGGVFKVNSAPGKGSQFTIIVPLNRHQLM